LDADKLVPVLDAASISASKVFKVLAIIVINQKYCSYLCSQTICKFWMQKNCCQYWMQHNSLHPK